MEENAIDGRNVFGIDSISILLNDSGRSLTLHGPVYSRQLLEKCNDKGVFFDDITNLTGKVNTIHYLFQNRTTGRDERAFLTFEQYVTRGKPSELEQIKSYRTLPNSN